MNYLRIFLFLLMIASGQFLNAQNLIGSTTLDIDPSTNIVTATCETSIDDFDYEPDVQCSVYDGAGNRVAAQGNINHAGSSAQVVLTFQGQLATTYTAIGSHIAISNIADLPSGGHGPTYYEDYYNYSSFEQGGTPTYPNYFDWYGPGPDTEVRNPNIQVGNTTATAFTATPIQHNYPNNPFSFACWISSYFDATRTTGAHHADDVTKSNGGNSHAAPPLGTPVYAMEAGTVVATSTGQPAAPYPSCSSQNPRPPGDYAKIKGTDNYTTLYFHMNPSVVVGQQVSAGQQIGVLDSSGCQSAPHLHVGRKDPQNNSVNFTIPCVNPLPTGSTKFDDGSIVDNDPDTW